MILKKMSIRELQSDSNEVLLREQMKATKGGKKGGGCYVYCENGHTGISQSCNPSLCNGGNWMCLDWDHQPC